MEFALLFPFLLVLTFITTEFGRALYEYQGVTKSVREAARYLSTQNPDSHQAEAANLIVYGSIAGGTTPLVRNLTTANVLPPSWTQVGTVPLIKTVTVGVTGYQFRSIFTTVFGAAVRHRHLLRHHGHDEEPPMSAHKQRGATAVEFALVLVMFLTVVLGITDFARMLVHLERGQRGDARGRPLRGGVRRHRNDAAVLAQACRPSCRSIDAGLQHRLATRTAARHHLQSACASKHRGPELPLDVTARGSARALARSRCPPSRPT